MSFNGYVQVPPDSTGKKVGHVILVELDYDTGTIAFTAGERVTGASSGATGTVVKIVGTTSSGELYLSLDYESPLAFIVGENLQVAAVTHAKAASVGSLLYTPQVSIVDHENMFNGVNVSDKGELLTTAAEGGLAFDAFGMLKVSQEYYLGLYNYEYGINAEEVNTETSSLGLGETILPPTPIGNLAYSGIVMTNPATSGSYTNIQSHLYHPYNAGTSQKWIGSIACGDSGTAGVVRRWGYFDDEDGLFFELSGSTVYCVIRNSSTGTVVETKIPQSQWNSDKADGSGGDLNISNATLNPGKGFVYFIDFQWLGVGRVRFGIVWNGARVVVHEFTHSNELDYPYMRTGTLPARVEQVNYGTAAGPVVLKTFSMAVIASAQSDPHTGRIRSQTSTYTTTVDWTGSFRPVFSIKSAPYFNGKENRSVIIPTQISFYSEDAPMLVRIMKWPTLTGATWNISSSNHTLVGDITATTASGGIPVFNCIIPVGEVHDHEFPTEWDDCWKVHRKDRIIDDNCAWTTTVQLLNTKFAPSSSFSVVMNWKELQ